MKRERPSIDGDSEHGNDTNPLLMPAPAKRQRPPSSAVLFDRRAHFRGEEQSLYGLLRSWVKNYPTDSVPPPPGSPPQQLLRSPLPQSELTRRRLPRRPHHTSKEVIVGSMPAVDTDTLLSSHITYSREVKKWWQLKRCHRLARYRDRLRQLNITVDAAGGVHLLNEVEEQNTFQSPVAFSGSPPLQLKNMSFSPADGEHDPLSLDNIGGSPMPGAGAGGGMGRGGERSGSRGVGHPTPPADMRAPAQRRASMDAAGLASIAGDLVSLASGLYAAPAADGTGPVSPSRRGREQAASAAAGATGEGAGAVKAAGDA